MVDLTSSALTLKSELKNESSRIVATRTLLETKGFATRSKDATRGSWPYY